MNRRTLIFIVFIIGFGYWLYKKSKAVVQPAVISDEFKDVMSSDPDLH